MEWLQAHLVFLQSEWFNYFYGLIVFLNPIAIAPQILSSFRAKPEELRGVSISMFIIFLTIQLTVSLGAIRYGDLSLFISMLISAVITLTVIMVTVIKRNKR